MGMSFCRIISSRGDRGGILSKGSVRRKTMDRWCLPGRRGAAAALIMMTLPFVDPFLLGTPGSMLGARARASPSCPPRRRDTSHGRGRTRTMLLRPAYMCTGGVRGGRDGEQHDEAEFEHDSWDLMRKHHAGQWMVRQPPPHDVTPNTILCSSMCTGSSLFSRRWREDPMLREGLPCCERAANGCGEKHDD